MDFEKKTFSPNKYLRGNLTAFGAIAVGTVFLAYSTFQIYKLSILAKNSEKNSIFLQYDSICDNLSQARTARFQYTLDHVVSPNTSGSHSLDMVQTIDVNLDSQITSLEDDSTKIYNSKECQTAISQVRELSRNNTIGFCITCGLYGLGIGVLGKTIRRRKEDFYDYINDNKDNLSDVDWKKIIKENFSSKDSKFFTDYITTLQK